MKRGVQEIFLKPNLGQFQDDFCQLPNPTHQSDNWFFNQLGEFKIIVGDASPTVLAGIQKWFWSGDNFLSLENEYHNVRWLILMTGPGRREISGKTHDGQADSVH
jgi:hypothetical protein